PEAEIAKVAIGQTAHVACDGCAPMDARVSFISDRAEYTPPEIYSLEERAKLVFRVEAVPQDPTGVRPGLPIDVTLSPPESR
ncbi:MAG: multidrug transporter, partial [Rhizobium sp.]|nr:multidrug transporter [Rhizobium sp.]